MKAKQLLLSTIIAATLGLGNVAYAEYGDGGYGNHQSRQAGKMRNKSPEQRLDKMAKRLGLSEAQKQQVSSLIQANKAKMEPLKNQMRDLKRATHALNPSAQDFSTQLNNIAEQKADLVRRMTIAKGQNHQQLFNLLTPEQQAKMKEMRDKRMQKRMERGNH